MRLDQIQRHNCVGSLKVAIVLSQTFVLILGGAASGKSAYAENLVSSWSKTLFYLATAQAFDDEMSQRIERHKIRRKTAWQTIEAPDDLAGTLRAIPPDAAVLVDCATLWLSNRLLAGQDLPRGAVELLAALKNCASPVAVVSNETGYGIVPDSALARRFRDEQGLLNQQLAVQADTVVAVMAGLPLTLKGTLPQLPKQASI